MLTKNEKRIKTVRVGAERTSLYINLLRGRSVAVVANQTSVIKNQSQKEYVHLVDSLISLGIDVQKVFAPEHGFRGKADAGEAVKNGVDAKTGLPIISLYGKNKKPTKAQLQGVEVVVFDIQDVGARFYTYISSLHYVMEACAEAGISVIILDRPNPNAHYIDGPVLEKPYKSFVGMHRVPVVYGMTIGEYGQMINGENWLKNKVRCDLKVVPLQHYTHTTSYSLPIKPSPNLPNDKSINLYPSLCFFEGTNVSVGRGTEMQFQIVGSPLFDDKKNSFSFVPKPNFGSKYPKYKGEKCTGYDLRSEVKLNRIELKWLLDFYKVHNRKGAAFFNKFFVKLAGTDKLQKQIEQGFSEQKIRNSWKRGIADFKKVRKKYLLYK